MSLTSISFTDKEAGNFITKKLILSDGKEIEIPQRASDGYINVTKLCKGAGKELFNWTGKKVEEILNGFSESIGIPRDILLDKSENFSVPNHLRGTFAHPLIAIQIAQWCSVDFSIQVSKWIYELSTTGQVQIGKEKSIKEIDDINVKQLQDMLEESEAEVSTLVDIIKEKDNVLDSIRRELQQNRNCMKENSERHEIIMKENGVMLENITLLLLESNKKTNYLIEKNEKLSIKLDKTEVISKQLSSKLTRTEEHSLKISSKLSKVQTTLEVVKERTVPKAVPDDTKEYFLLVEDTEYYDTYHMIGTQVRRLKSLISKKEIDEEDIVLKLNCHPNAISLKNIIREYYCDRVDKDGKMLVKITGNKIVIRDNYSLEKLKRRIIILDENRE